jgi:SAM-dependent methyltransferase
MPSGFPVPRAERVVKSFCCNTYWRLSQICLNSFELMSKSMTDYYQQNYRTYHEKTFFVDPSSFLTPFAENLKPKATILDIGCGSGRDLLWLKKLGFKATGFERSPSLADLAGKNAGCDVIEGDFETYDFSNIQSDAVLFSGSLVAGSSCPVVLSRRSSQSGVGSFMRSLVCC